MNVVLTVGFIACAAVALAVTAIVLAVLIEWAESQMRTIPRLHVEPTIRTDEERAIHELLTTVGGR